MGLVVLVVVGALAVAWLRGGTLRRLSKTPLRGRRVIAAAVALQAAGVAIAGFTGSAGWYVAGLAGSAAAGLAFCVGNRAVPGVALLGLGLTLNAAVVAANGTMPVSWPAAARAGADIADVVTGADPGHTLAGPATRLRWLGDVVAVPLPLRPEVDSPGDVLIAAGLAEFVVAGMGSRRRPSARHRATPASRPSGLPGQAN